MNPAAYRKGVSSARKLQEAGRLEEAYEAYVAVGAFDQAAQVLAAQRRFEEAGHLLFTSLRTDPKHFRRLSEDLRKRALRAAIYLSRGRESAMAVEMFVQLGERQRAVDLLRKLGDESGALRVESGQPYRTSGAGSLAYSAVGGAVVTIQAAQKLEADGKLEAACDAYVQLKRFREAASVATRLGKTAQAADLFARAAMPFEAAVTYREAGDTGACLENLVRVPPEDPRYRQACFAAIEVACELGVLEFKLDTFLSDLIADGPLHSEEIPSFMSLAALYAKHDFVQNAKEVYGKVLAQAPDHPEATQRLAGLEDSKSTMEARYRRILHEDAAFRSASERSSRPSTPILPMAELPGLPELPTLPTAAPQSAARRDRRSSNQGTESMTIAHGHGPPAVVVGRPLAEVEPPRRSETDLFQAGSVIANRYRIKSRLGAGGLATVFRAADIDLDEDVALKVLKQAIRDEAVEQRFKLELKVTRQLAHANIIRIYDIGSYAGYRYISMELLEGKSLADLVGRLTIPQAVDILQQTARGLKTAHDLGVIHRDIKPANLFLAKGGTVKLMDFGLAKASESSSLTATGMIMGTPKYMSPDQIDSARDVTPASDLYSVGVVAYELLTGRVPFVHTEVSKLLMMHITQPAQPPRELNPQIPEDLERIVMQLLEKDPLDRYPHCKALLAALDPVGRSLAGR